MTGATIPRIDDTIVALSSPPGPGSRAIIRLSGPQSWALAEARFTSDHTLKDGFVSPGSFRLTQVHSLLPGYVLARRGPRTATGQDLVELHIVSSPPLVDRLIADLISAGARAAGPGEFTMRAFLSGKKNLPQSEAVLAVIHAGSDADLTSALSQMAGGLTRPLDRLRDDLLNLLADLEAGLDFADEDISFVGLAEVGERIRAANDQLTDVLSQLDDRAVSGRPRKVVLAGKPNAGKSQLFNALVGRDAAIVSPVAGTTRDYVSHLDRERNIEWIDTAGWDDADDFINARSQELGHEQRRQADLILHCVPVTDAVERSHLHGLLVRTKADLPHTPTPDLTVSALTGEGMAELRTLVDDRLRSNARPALAPSLSRCRGHVEQAIRALERATSNTDTELIALDLRSALHQIGEMTGAIVTNDLLDRVFSRFCIGK